MPAESISNEVVSWYDKIPSNLLTKYHNPSFESHKMSVPFRLLVVGASGTNKTLNLIELIHRMQDTFGMIHIVCRCRHEPLYDFLATKIHDDQLFFYEGYEQTPDINNLDPDVQHLIVWDDLVLEKQQQLVEEYFIRGRKVAKGCSLVYISQSYWAIPKIIRLQASYIFLKKVSSTKDIKFILSDHNLGIDKEVLLDIYKRATENIKDFLMLDLNAPAPQRFRLNFLQVIDVDKFTEL